MWLIVALGIVLRLRQYLGNASLFIDEAMLASSIVGRSVFQLVGSPLDYVQVAPPLFLVAAKIAGFGFDYSEYALRAPAFLSAALALGLFVSLARITLRGSAIPFAVCLLAISPTLIKYAAEVKQYSGDVLATVVMTIVTLKVIESGFSRKQLLLAGSCGLVAVWFSQASIIVLCGLLVALLAACVSIRSKDAILATLSIGAVWGVASALSVSVTLRVSRPEARSYMQEYWDFAFLPFPPSSMEDFLWPWKILRGLYWNGLNLWGVATAAVLIGVWGIISFWRRGRPDIALALASPVAVAILLSAAHLYPFSGRLLLFTFPALVLCLAEGIWSITGMVPERANRLKHSRLLFLGIPLYLIARDAPPWFNEELKPVLHHVVSNKRGPDQIYVFHGAEPAMRYYAPRYGLRQNDWTSGNEYGGNVAAYLDELNRFRRDGRIWLIFSHDDVFPAVRPALTAHMDTIGFRVDSVAFPEVPRGSGSKAYLFDLGLRETVGVGLPPAEQ